MEPQVDREAVFVRGSGADMGSAHMGVTAPAVAQPTGTVIVERHHTISSIAPHALAAGLLGVALTVWGGVTLARAGVDESWREPIVDVAGLTGTAAGGGFVLAAGVLLLLSALARSRGAIVGLAVLVGIGGLIVAIEPELGDGVLGGDAALGWWVAAGSAVVALLALMVPTFVRRTSRVDAA